MSATFPPLGGAGGAAAGLVAGQSVSRFVPDENGNPPAGWTYLDGTSYDPAEQRASAYDGVPAFDVLPTSNLKQDPINPLALQDTDLGRTRYHLAFSGGYCEWSRTDSGEGIQAVVYAGGKGSGAWQGFMSGNQTDMAGHTTPAPWTDLYTFEQLSKTVTPGEFGEVVEIDALVGYRTSDNKIWVARTAFSTSSFGFEAVGSALELTDAAPDQPFFFVGRSGNVLTFVYFDAVTYAPAAAQLDLDTWTVTPITLVEDEPNSLMYGRPFCASVATGLVSFRDQFSKDRTTLRRFTVTETTVSVETLGSTPAEKYAGAAGLFLPRADGFFWAFSPYEVLKLDPDTFKVVRVAGLHPQVAKAPSAFEYTTLGVSLSDDLLNDVSALSLAWRNRYLGTPESPRLNAAEAQIRFGVMFSTFTPAAVYTG